MRLVKADNLHKGGHRGVKSGFERQHLFVTPMVLLNHWIRQSMTLVAEVCTSDLSRVILTFLDISPNGCSLRGKHAQKYWQSFRIRYHFNLARRNSRHSS